MATCLELGVPVTARGAGTSIAGNAVGPGVVMDLGRHLGRVLALDPEAATATVEPGVVLDDLQAAARPHGLRFGPDPSTHSRCTLGGMIGNNACGSRALAYGRTADNVLELEVVCGTGQRLRAGPGGAAAVPGLEEVVRANLAPIRTQFGRFARQNSGYQLEHLLPERGGDLARALAGSEGTLAVVLQATVRLVRAPAAAVLVVLGYPDMATAADAVGTVLPRRPVALEGIDARIVEVVRRRGRAVPELPEGGGWLLVELAGATAAEAEAAAGRLVAEAGGDALASRVLHRPGRGGRHLAHPRGRGRVRRAQPGRGAGLGRLGGRGRPARAARRLPARLRGPAGRQRAGRHPLRPLRRRLPARAHRLPLRPARRAGGLPVVRRAGGRAGRLLRRLDVGRARRRARPLRAAPPDVRAGRDRGHGRRQGRPRPARPAQPGGAGAPAPLRRRPAPHHGPAGHRAARVPLSARTAAT